MHVNLAYEKRHITHIDVVGEGLAPATFPGKSHGEFR